MTDSMTCAEGSRESTSRSGSDRGGVDKATPTLTHPGPQSDATLNRCVDSAVPLQAHSGVQLSDLLARERTGPPRAKITERNRPELHPHQAQHGAADGRA